MRNIDWFYVFFGSVGLLALLSGCYEWGWLWRLAQGGFLPDQIGWRNTRLLYTFGGAGCLGFGIAATLQSLFQSNSFLFFAIGFSLSAVFTIFLFRLRGPQTLWQLITEPEDKFQTHDHGKDTLR